MDRLPVKPSFVEVDGDAPDVLMETARLGALIPQHPVDVCFAGIGENGHLAFNDSMPCRGRRSRWVSGRF